MAASIRQTDTIDGSGHPLGFKVAQGGRRPGSLGVVDGRDTFKVEARALGGHQKEAVVTEGASGSSWRLVSDEGPGLQGTDLAPFPLGFMAAGLQADLANRIDRIARARGIGVSGLAMEVDTDYAFEGSFFKGDGRGSARPPVFRIVLASESDPAALRAVVDAALDASPLIAALRTPLANTFALHVNGARRPLAHLRNSDRPAAVDPLKAWSDVPRPLAGASMLPDIIAKVGPVAAAAGMPAAIPGQAVRIEIPIRGAARAADGIVRAETWANRHGGSRFAIASDERDDGDLAPTGLSLAFAGVAFCLMTQLLRYVEYHKMGVRALRIVQTSDCEIAGGVAVAHALDTHVFVHGDESEETMERLVQMAANTCYLHAALHGALEPVVALECGGARESTPTRARAEPARTR